MFAVSKATPTAECLSVVHTGLIPPFTNFNVQPTLGQQRANRIHRTDAGDAACWFEGRAALVMSVLKIP